MLVNIKIELKKKDKKVFWFYSYKVVLYKETNIRIYENIFNIWHWTLC